LLKKNKKPKPRLPTAEEFFQFRPRRLDFEWSVNDEGFVEIKVPKFKSNFGKSFCKVIKKDNDFVAKMDKMGTIIWKNCEGNKTVKELLEMIQKEFPDEKNMDQRLILFIQQMGSLNYIIY